MQFFFFAANNEKIIKNQIEQNTKQKDEMISIQPKLNQFNLFLIDSDDEDKMIEIKTN